MTDFHELYQKGLSLNEISTETGFAVTTIRDTLVRHQTPLRPSKKAIVDDTKKPKRTIWGAIPYGYNVLDGKIVVDPKEIKVVRKILDLHQKDMSFNAISRWLSSQKIQTKLNKKWSDKTVASIIRKHKNQTD